MLTFNYNLVSGVIVVHKIEEYVGKLETPEHIRASVNKEWEELQTREDVDQKTLFAVIDIPGEQLTVMKPTNLTAKNNIESKQENTDDKVFYCKVKFRENGPAFTYVTSELVPKDVNSQDDEYVNVVLDTPFGIDIRRPFEAGSCTSAQLEEALKGRKKSKIRGFFLSSLKGHVA